jgi:glycosyltransferase involved in cell wall biosynthesis
MAPLTFGIDGRAATEEGAGAGRVVRELLRALSARDDEHHYRVFARTAWDEPRDERFTWVCNGAPDPLWNVRAADAASRTCDAFLSSNSYLTAWMTRIPCAPMVHDLVAFDPALRAQRRASLIERATLGWAVRRSAALIAVSQATADALTARFAAARGKVVVAHHGVSSMFDDITAAEEPRPGTPPAGFVLAVGTIEPRKNLPRLTEAYGRLPASLRAAHPLVVTGRIGWDTGETLAALDALGDRAVRTGFVPDEQLASLYRRCSLFAYPSLGEGFGLPVLEAMAAGAPVLTSDRSSLPEVGGDAVAYCDPTDVASIAGALEALLADGGRRAELRHRGPLRAAQFSWDRSAAIVVETLQRIATASPLPS